MHSMHHDFSGIGSRCGWQTDNREVGTWLNNILKKGGTEDWRKVLKEATGEDISTRAMMDYFEPLMSWLEEQNKGRQIGWE
jgi:peptidyl-dipeptidase A